MGAIDKIIETPFLLRRDGESKFAYHKRLLKAKLIDKTLDVDYSTLAPYLYGQEYAPDVARRMAYGSMKTVAMMENEAAAAEPGLKEELDRQLAELRVERQKLSDYRTSIGKAIRERARQEELNEIIREAILKSDLPELVYKPFVAKSSNNDLLITLNDIHYGANVNNAWCTYNSQICEKMMGNYLDRIFEIQKTHGSENCTVVCAGDCISGNIHYSIAISNRENVIEQVMGVSELIARFLSELSERFGKVTFVSVSGNHSRLNPNKDEAVEGERLDDLVAWYLGARLQNYDNVVIDHVGRIDPTMAVFMIRDKKYCCVHGDYDGSENKIRSVQDMSGGNIHAVISGHLHHNATDTVQGIKTVMAGSFLGMDDYCVRKRIISKPEQTVCVCTSDGIECIYPVELKK